MKLNSKPLVGTGVGPGSWAQEKDLVSPGTDSWKSGGVLEKQTTLVRRE